MRALYALLFLATAHAIRIPLSQTQAPPPVKVKREEETVPEQVIPIPSDEGSHSLNEADMERAAERLRQQIEELEELQRQQKTLIDSVSQPVQQSVEERLMRQLDTVMGDTQAAAAQESSVSRLIRQLGGVQISDNVVIPVRHASSPIQALDGVQVMTIRKRGGRVIRPHPFQSYIKQMAAPSISDILFSRSMRTQARPRQMLLVYDDLAI